MSSVRGIVKDIAALEVALARRMLPVAARMDIVSWLGDRPGVPFRDWLSIELLRDFAEQDPSACHRFLWTHHLAYAESYHVEQRFGAERLNATRHLLFEDVRRFLSETGSDPAGIRSVFEVGCSLGYLLRHLETDLFTSATVLEGIDIDRRAVEEGSAHLASIGSKVRLATADTSDLDVVLDGRTFDLILCAGVLLYLPPDEARRAVAEIVRHTGTLAVFAGLAHPDQDNATLASAARRQRDGTFIHDIDRMVREGGGHVAWRRWEGDRRVDDTTMYFVFARPGPSPH